MFGDDSDDESSPAPKIEDQSASSLLQLRPTSNGILAFHNGTEEALLLYVEKTAIRGNPDSVLITAPPQAPRFYAWV